MRRNQGMKKKKESFHMQIRNIEELVAAKVIAHLREGLEDQIKLFRDVMYDLVNENAMSSSAFYSGSGNPNLFRTRLQLGARMWKISSAQTAQSRRAPFLWEMRPVCKPVLPELY